MDEIAKSTLTILKEYAEENHPTEVGPLMADCWRQMIRTGHVPLAVTLRADLAPETITVDGIRFHRETDQDFEEARTT